MNSLNPEKGKRPHISMTRIKKKKKTKKKYMKTSTFAARTPFVKMIIISIN